MAKGRVGERVEQVNKTAGALGDYLKEQRLLSRLSLRQLAEQAGVSNPYLSQIERGLRKPSAEVLQQIAKDGAEAVFAAALADGRAVALKIADGGQRARPVVMAEALRRDGVPTDAGVDAAGLDDTGRVPVLGAGEPVGEIRAAF